MSDEDKKGPIYSVRLIDALPLSGGMMQAMASRSDLEQVRKVNERVAAAYEVLLWHFHRLQKTSEQHNRVEVDE